MPPRKTSTKKKKIGHWRCRGNTMSFYNLYDGHVHRDIHGELYGIPRKKYARTHEYPKHAMHFSSLPREKTAIIKLRNFGYSINHLHEALGRSNSFIHAVLKQGRNLGLVHVNDNRKRSRKSALYNARRKLVSCLFHVRQWTAFICGEDSDPP